MHGCPCPEVCGCLSAVLHKERLYQRLRRGGATVNVPPEVTSGWASPRSDAPLEPLSSEHLSALSEIEVMNKKLHQLNFAVELSAMGLLLALAQLGSWQQGCPACDPVLHERGMTTPCKRLHSLVCSDATVAVRRCSGISRFSDEHAG